jgi:hypothetical protein
VADPNTGVWVADPYNLPSANPWLIAGGTSLSAPAWAGLVALADQGRDATGVAPLSSSAGTLVEQALYSLPAADFNSISTGSNGGYQAAAGYNLVTGLGSPVANLLVPDLIAYQGSSGANVTAADLYNIAPAADASAAGSANVFRVYDFETGGDALGSAAGPGESSRDNVTGAGAPFVPSGQPAGGVANELEALLGGAGVPFVPSGQPGSVPLPVAGLARDALAAAAVALRANPPNLSLPASAAAADAPASLPVPRQAEAAASTILTPGGPARARHQGSSAAGIVQAEAAPAGSPLVPPSDRSPAREADPRRQQLAAARGRDAVALYREDSAADRHGRHEDPLSILDGAAPADRAVALAAIAAAAGGFGLGAQEKTTPAEELRRRRSRDLVLP